MPKWTLAFLTILVFAESTTVFSQPVMAPRGDLANLRDQFMAQNFANTLPILQKYWANPPHADQRPYFGVGLGYTFFSQKKYDEAQAVLSQVILQKSLTEDYARFWLARTYQEKRMFKEAQNEFEQVLRLKPNSQLRTEASFQVANVLLEQGQLKAAQNNLIKLEKKWRRSPRYPELLWALMRASQGSGATLCKRAKQLYIRFPTFAGISSWTSDFYNAQLAGKPIRCSLNFEERRSRVKALMQSGDIAKAKIELEVLRTQTPRNDKYESDKLLIQFMLSQGDVEEALQMLLPFYQGKKGDLGYLLLLANAAAKSGQFPMAVGNYYQVYKVNPRSKYAKKALYQAAFLSYQSQDYDGASRKFQEFISKYATSGLSQDAKWHLAWIRYLKGDYDGALKGFSQVKVTKRTRRRAAKSALQMDRITYWTGMSLFRQNKFNESRRMFESLVAKGPSDFYSIAAHYRLKKIPKSGSGGTSNLVVDSLTPLTGPRQGNFRTPFPEGVPVVSAEPEVDENLSAETEEDVDKGGESEVAVEEDDAGESKEATEVAVENAGETSEDPELNKESVLKDRLSKARQFEMMGLVEFAKWDLQEVEKRTRDRDKLKMLVQDYESVGLYNRSFQLAQSLYGNLGSKVINDSSKPFWQTSFPAAYQGSVKKYSQDFSVPQELIWGIMRAESHYQPEAVSPVGALGLMQVMPNTGNRLSAIMGDKSFDTKRLLEPDTCIKMGSKYLQRLMKQFENNMALAAASYNAGPHRVQSWLLTFGQVDLDEFIEHIPFVETRNYVKRVMTNAYVYSTVYSLTKDPLANLIEPVTVKGSPRLALKEVWEEN